MKDELKTLKRRFTNLKSHFIRDYSDSQAATWNSPMVGAWLCIIGLDVYLDKFLENGVDGVTLLYLKSSQYQRCLGISNESHAYSLRLGLRLLKSTRLDYSHWEWSCDATQRWLDQRNFSCVSQVFKDNAVHGGVLFSFTKSKLKDFLSNLASFDQNLFSPIVFKSLWYSIKRVKKTKTSFLYPEKYVEDWGEVEIERWLSRINLAHLKQRFSSHGINGTCVVRLTQKDLFSIMGLTELQSKVIIRHIRTLRQVVEEDNHDAAKILETPLNTRNINSFQTRKTTTFETTSESSVSTT